jgi:hypothetical protein
LTIAADRSADDAARGRRASRADTRRRRSLGTSRARTSRPRIAARVVIDDARVIVIMLVVVVVVVVPVRAFRSEDANGWMDG